MKEAEMVIMDFNGGGRKLMISWLINERKVLLLKSHFCCNIVVTVEDVVFSEIHINFICL